MIELCRRHVGSFPIVLRFNPDFIPVPPYAGGCLQVIRGYMVALITDDFNEALEAFYEPPTGGRWPTEDRT